jgi:hypothetical protein
MPHWPNDDFDPEDVNTDMVEVDLADLFLESVEERGLD